MQRKTSAGSPAMRWRAASAARSNRDERRRSTCARASRARRSDTSPETAASWSPAASWRRCAPDSTGSKTGSRGSRRGCVPAVAGRCRVPRAEAGAVVRPGWSVPRLAVAWLAFAMAAASAGAATQAPAPSPWPEGNVEALPDVLVQALAKAGLIGRGEPVAAFTWTLEAKRPARAPRRTHERFAGTPPGAPAGLSPMLREHLSPKARPPRAGVSVRGLTVVRADDTGLDVVVDGLALPLEQGARFQLGYHEDGSSLAQSC